MTVHTNLEATAIILATGFLGGSMLEAALIVASFAVGTGLHLLCHLGVAAAFGKGIDRMILTRAGRIDYSGPAPSFGENILRPAAGASMNALCAIVAYAVIDNADVTHWNGTAVLALRTFASCSLILTIINFLPAVPLDGGLILNNDVIGARRPLSLSSRGGHASSCHTSLRRRNGSVHGGSKPAYVGSSCAVRPAALTSRRSSAALLSMSSRLREPRNASTATRRDVRSTIWMLCSVGAGSVEAPRDIGMMNAIRVQPSAD